MAAKSLVERVATLEEQVSGLQSLPKDVAEFRRDVDQRFASLERAMRDGDDRLGSQMRMLHEDLVSRIKLPGEARNPAESSGLPAPRKRKR